MTDVYAARRHFSIPDGISYLNAAALGPLPQSAVEAGHNGLSKKQHPWNIRSRTFFEDTRSVRPKLARLIKADVEGIAFSPSASYGMAVAAKNTPLKRGERIVILADQFPSNVYAWRRLADETGAELITVAGDHGQSVTDATLSAIDDRTGLVAIPQVRWTDGALVDAKRIAEAAHAVGAKIVFDLSQSCGVFPFDVTEVRPDYVVCVGYKWLLGPYSLGFLYVAPEHRNGVPLEENWISREGSTDFSRLIDYTDTYEAGARRFDVGERANFALLPALEASLDLLGQYSINDIGHYLGGLTDRISEGLKEMNIHCPPKSQRPPHYLCAKLPVATPPNLTELLEEKGVYVSRRGDWLRISPHIYNTEMDIEQFLDGLQSTLSHSSVLS